MIVDLEFDEVGISADGASEAGGFSGTASIDLCTGVIDRIEIETVKMVNRRPEPGTPIVGYRDLKTEGGCGAGHYLLHALEPVIRRRYASKMSDLLHEWHWSAKDRRADQHRDLEAV